jgi:copper chaperone CopZ
VDERGPHRGFHDRLTCLYKENDMTAQTDTPGSVTTVYKVSGMSCGHCEGAVSGELSEVAGVSSVKAVASTGEVTVVSAAPLDEEAVRAAVDEAGFELVGKA